MCSKPLFFKAQRDIVRRDAGAMKNTPEGSEQPSNSSENSDDPDIGAAESGASPSLNEVITAWPRLTPAQRVRVLAVARAVARSTP